LQSWRESVSTLVSPGVDKISSPFGCGASARWLCGERLKRCTLELGGKSAAIILDDVIGYRYPYPVAKLDYEQGRLIAQTRILAPRARTTKWSTPSVSGVAAMVWATRMPAPK